MSQSPQQIIAGLKDGSISMLDFAALLQRNPALKEQMKAQLPISPAYMQKIRQLAQKGSMHDQLKMGWIHKDKKEYKEAYEWYYQAAHNKNPSGLSPEHEKKCRGEAFATLANLCLQEVGVPIEKYDEYIQLAIQHEPGDVAQQYAQAQMRKPNRKITKKTASIWEKMAEQGNPFAEAALGVLYWLGSDHVVPDMSLALKYLSSAQFKVSDKTLLSQIFIFYFNLKVEWSNDIFSRIVVDDAKLFACCKTLSMQHGVHLPLGICFLNGWGVPKDPKRAFECFEKERANSEPWKDVEVWVGLTYLQEGNDWKREPKQAIEIFEKEVRKENGSRIRAVSELINYYEAVGDLPKACEWTEKKLTLVKDDPPTLRLLGECYEKESGIQDLKRAVECYKASALGHNPKALFKMGTWYLEGVNVDKNPALGIQYLEEAMNLGHPQAACTLGECYHFGREVPKDENRAVACYKIAVKGKDARACGLLGHCYHHGIGGLKKDPKLALIHYKLSEQYGSAAFIVKIGFCSLSGEGTTCDPVVAVSHFKQVEHFDPMAQYYLGVCYEVGRGVVKDNQLSFEYYNKASSLFPARLRRAICYMLGKGTPKDIKKAMEEYQLILHSLESTHSIGDVQIPVSEDVFNEFKSQCLFLMGQCYFLGMEGELDLKTCRNYLEQASNLNHPYAQLLLGEFYEKGLGGDSNLAKARELYRKATQNGAPEAKTYAEAQERRRQHNGGLFAQFLNLPKQMKDLKDNSNYNFEVLMAEVNARVDSILELNEKLDSKIESKELEKIQKAKEEISAFLAEKDVVLEQFSNVFEFFRKIISMACDDANSEIDPVFNLVANQLEKYRVCYKEIANRNEYFLRLQTDLEIRFKAEQAKKEKEKKAEKEDILRRTNQELEEKQREEAQRVALIRRQEEQKKYEEIRTRQKADWHKTMKQFDEDLKKQQEVNKLRNSSDVNLRAVSYWFEQSNHSHRDRALSSSYQPSQRTLADWQPDLMIRISAEEKLLQELYQHIQTAAIQDQRWSLEDYWIEREALKNILGRLMELVKDFHGKTIALPRKAAEQIRNVLLKHDYFEAIRDSGSTSAETRQKISEKNAELRLAVGNLLNFFKTAKVSHVPLDWASVAAEIHSPLLDDIIAKSSRPEFAAWTIDTADLKRCCEKVDQEDKNLKRLAKYKTDVQGIFARKDGCNPKIHDIVELSIKSRWGSVSSYVKANQQKLFPPRHSWTAEHLALYNRLVVEDYIALGRDFRHAKQPLIFAEPNTVLNTVPKMATFLGTSAEHKNRSDRAFVGVGMPSPAPAPVLEAAAAAAAVSPSAAVASPPAAVIASPAAAAVAFQAASAVVSPPTALAALTSEPPAQGSGNGQAGSNAKSRTKKKGHKNRKG